MLPDVVWRPHNSSSQYLDPSDYVNVTVDTELQTLNFAATSNMYGIVDFGSPVRWSDGVGQYNFSYTASSELVNMFSNYNTKITVDLYVCTVV